MHRSLNPQSEDIGAEGHYRECIVKKDAISISGAGVTIRMHRSSNPQSKDIGAEGHYRECMIKNPSVKTSGIYHQYFGDWSHLRMYRSSNPHSEDINHYQECMINKSLSDASSVFRGLKSRMVNESSE